MKIFSSENLILAFVISSAHGNFEPRSMDAMVGRHYSFTSLPDLFFTTSFVKDVVQARYPKFWRKWIERKSDQFSKLGEQVKRPFERCGTDQT